MRQKTNALPAYDTKVTAISSEYLHSAAMIDANGNEIPITEEMILKACDRIENALGCKRHNQLIQRCQ
jgi:hypothetical protein